MISFTADQIAAQLKGEVCGDGAVALTGCACAAKAHAGDLVFAESEAHFAAAEHRRGHLQRDRMRKPPARRALRSRAARTGPQHPKMRSSAQSSS